MKIFNAVAPFIPLIGIPIVFALIMAGHDGGIGNRVTWLTSCIWQGFWLFEFLVHFFG